jgi:hypothetical protein
VSGTLNPAFGGFGLSPSHHQLPSNPSSPIASSPGGSRNFSGASYTSFVTNTSRPNSSQNFPPNIHSPITPDGARAYWKKRNSSTSGGLFAKKKKDDDIGVATAWRLKSGDGEHLDEYDFGPLIRGEPVRLADFLASFKRNNNLLVKGTLVRVFLSLTHILLST